MVQPVLLGVPGKHEYPAEHADTVTVGIKAEGKHSVTGQPLKVLFEQQGWYLFPGNPVVVVQLYSNCWPAEQVVGVAVPPPTEVGWGVPPIG